MAICLHTNIHVSLRKFSFGRGSAATKTSWNKCVLCNKYHWPTINIVLARIYCLSGISNGLFTLLHC